MWLLSMCEGVELECKGLSGRNEACLRQGLMDTCRLAWRLYVVYYVRWRERVRLR